MPKSQLKRLLFHRLFSRRNKPTRQANRRNVVRPRLEHLEDRRLLTTIILDFDGLPGNTSVGHAVNEDGFRVQSVSGSSGLLTRGNGYPFSAAQGVTLYNGSNGGNTQLVRSDGGNFRLTSIELNSLNGNAPAQVPFTAFPAAGGSFGFSFLTDANYSTFQTFGSPTSSNLSSLQWAQLNNAGDFHQFDNVILEIGPTIDSITPVSPDPRATTVSSVDVTFNEAIDLSSFTFADLLLTRNGSPVSLDSSVTVSHASQTTYTINGLSSFTGDDGDYVLTVNALNILSPSGLQGRGTASDSWTKAGPVTVTSTTPSLVGGTLAAGSTSLQIKLSSAVSTNDATPVASLGSQQYPAYSAKQLLAVAPGTPSGVYWFDSDGDGPATPFEAYADMTTDGGGWMLAINSLLNSEAPSNEITAHSSVANLSLGHSRDVAYLAESQTAQVRHQIDATNQGQGVFHGAYTGHFSTMPPLGSFMLLSSSNTSLLSEEYSRSLSPATYGSLWYSGSAPFSSIPATPGHGANGPAIFGDPTRLINSHRIWVRETAAPTIVPGALPGDPVSGALDPGNYELRRAGSNGLLGEPNDNDDLMIPLDVSYDPSTNTATLTFTSLPEDVYRLTVKDSITDISGNAIDGDADGMAGGDFIREFVVGAQSHSLTSPNGFDFDVDFGGWGAGQLVQGTEYSFDGLGRLQIDGADFTPPEPHVAVGLAVQQSLSTASGQAIGGSFFTPNGMVPIAVANSGVHQISVSLGIRHTTNNPTQIEYRYLVNGVPRETRVTNVPTDFGGSFSELNLDDVQNLNTGDSVQVQLRLSFGSAELRTFSAVPQHRLQLARYDNIPGHPITVDGGRTMLTLGQSLSGLEVHRKVTVPAIGDEEFARTIDVFHNPTPATIIATVKIVGNLGSDDRTTVFATSSGDTMVETSDQWIGTDDDIDGGGTPAIIHFIQGPAGLQPTMVGLSGDRGDNIEWEYQITVPAGETIRLAYFTIVANTRTEAEAAANALVTSRGFDGQASAFLTQEELDSIVNFQFNTPPIAEARGPYTIAEGSPITLDATDTLDNEQSNTTLVYEWDFDYDGLTFSVDTTGIQPTVSFPDNFTSRTIAVRVTDDGGLTDIATTTLEVTNAPPTATILNGGPVTYGQAVTVSFIDALDLSPVDTLAGFRYSFGHSIGDLANTYGDAEVAALWSPELPAGTHTVYGRIFDKDDGYNEYSTTVIVEKAGLFVTVDDQNKVYGAADPVLTYTPSGTLFYGDTFNVISGVLLATATGADATAGTHIVTATNGTADNYNITHVNGTLSVDKAELTVTADNQNKIYGATDPVLTFTPSGTLFYSDNFNVISGVGLATATGADATAGTHAITANDGTANNYSITHTNGTLTVAKAELIVTANDQSKVYGQTDPALSYVATGFQFTDTEASVLTGMLDRATGENVGSYAIDQGTLSAGGNYSIDFSGADLEITKATLTVASVLTGVLARATGENVGSYTIDQGMLSAGRNYTIDFSGADLDITKATLTVAADGQTKVYGQNDPALSYVAIGFQLTDTEESVLTGMLDRATGENVGSYAIDQGTLSAGGNYTIDFSGADLDVTKATLTVAADGQTKVYGQNDPALSYVATGFQLTDTEVSVLTGVLARATGEDVGSYAINQGTLSAGGNYTIDFSGADFDITKATATIVVDGTMVTYDGTAHGATGSATGVSGEALAGLDLGASFTNAPGGTAHWVFTDATGNYLDASGAVEIVIDKRSVTVTADGQTKVYGEDDPALTYMITAGSLVDGDSFSGDMTRVPGENVGSYAIEQGTLALNGNYDLTFIGDQLTITKRAITVTADNQSKVYGQDDPPLTYQVEGSLAFTDAFFGNLARGAGENVGSYTIEQGTLELSDNYDLSFVEAQLTITHAMLTGDATSQDALNTAKQGMLNITVSNIEGFVNGENSDVFLAEAYFWITIGDRRFEFVPTSVTKVSDSSIAISYRLKNSDLQEDLTAALEEATSGATALKAGFAMQSTNYSLSDDYLTRLFSTGN